MRARSLLPVLLLGLVGCNDQAPQPAETGNNATPEIASLEDYGMPVDRSAQITAIDAATGDARGMPKDGGPIIDVTKDAPGSPAGKPSPAAKAAAVAPPAAGAGPPPVAIAPPPPPTVTPATTPAASSVTVPVEE